uniref:zinc finger protein with KRAB and SCAN domains 1-like isoform X1 n=1 Tax=Oncorhynchus gorbuscha TaxID=8017 RepID=UPI001EAF4E10|nr:zinc finger protein with KRAB and SCAN domains 1-like isoform X1 [Oncorhynchus gorbuscha]
MANSVAFHTQLASIMEVLANAAVAEICELVDNGYAVLHLEISQGQKENEALRRKLRMMELKVSRASAMRAGMGSSILAHSRFRTHVGMESRRTSSSEVHCRRGVDSQLVTSLFRDGKSPGDTGQTTTQRKPAALDEIKPKSPTIKEERREEAWDNHDQRERLSTGALNHSVDGGERHSNIVTEATQPISKQENASSCKWYMVKEMSKPECIDFKEERQEDTISLQNDSRIKGSVESGADEDDRGVIGHTQTDGLFEDYDPHINADRERESTIQKFQHTNVAHRVWRQGYSGLWTPRSTETDSEDPACSYSEEISPTHVKAHTKQQQQTSVAEESKLFAVESHNVKPVSAMLDSEPYEEKYKSSNNHSSNNLHPQNSISYETSENVGNLAGRCFSNSQGNIRGNTARPKVGIVQRYMAGHKMQHGVGKREKRFVCGFCRKSFTCPKYLQSHQRVHTGEKPFSCSQCGKRFGQAVYLKKHQNVHTGEKPFVCPLCGKQFADASNLIRHKSVHTGERPFI